MKQRLSVAQRFGIGSDVFFCAVKKAILGNDLGSGIKIQNCLLRAAQKHKVHITSNNFNRMPVITLSTSKADAWKMAYAPLEMLHPDHLPKGKVKAAIFDFDGTFSTLRCGWEKVMRKLMLELISGG